MYLDALTLARLVLGFVEPAENFALYVFPSGGVEAHVYGHQICLTAQQWRSAVDLAIGEQDGEKPSGPDCEPDRECPAGCEAGRLPCVCDGTGVEDGQDCCTACEGRGWRECDECEP